MEMNLYVKANSTEDSGRIGLRYYLIGRDDVGNDTSLLANGSDLLYVYDSATPEILSLIAFKNGNG